MASLPTCTAYYAASDVATFSTDSGVHKSSVLSMHKQTMTLVTFKSQPGGAIKVVKDKSITLSPVAVKILDMR